MSPHPQEASSEAHPAFIRHPCWRRWRKKIMDGAMSEPAGRPTHLFLTGAMEWGPKVQRPVRLAPREPGIRVASDAAQYTRGKDGLTHKIKRFACVSLPPVTHACRPGSRPRLHGLPPASVLDAHQPPCFDGLGHHLHFGPVASDQLPAVDGGRSTATGRRQRWCGQGTSGHTDSVLADTPYPVLPWPSHQIWANSSKRAKPCKPCDQPFLLELTELDWADVNNNPLAL